VHRALADLDVDVPVGDDAGEALGDPGQPDGDLAGARGGAGVGGGGGGQDGLLGGADERAKNRSGATLPRRPGPG